jgi:hypothetical protein
MLAASNQHVVSSIWHADERHRGPHALRDHINQDDWDIGKWHKIWIRDKLRH